MTQRLLTRRTVLRAGTASLALIALPLRLVDVFAVQSSTNSWTYSQWSGLVGQTFRASLPDGSTTNLKLSSCTNLMPAGASTTSGPQCFSMVFSGALAPVLGDATQMLSNARVGTVQLYMSPGNASGGTQKYLALVNRR
jgi:hypothetical protein